MSEKKGTGFFRKFLDMPVDSAPKTILVAVSLCLFCSMIVAFAAVNLRPLQEANKFQDKQKNILQVAGLYRDGGNISEAFRSFDQKIVDMKTGKFTELFDPKTFDDRAAAIDPELSTILEDDPASIGRRANYTTVYLLKNSDGSLDKVILPISGYGLWSTLYGFIAIEENGNDIFGLQFYEHSETPGLGAEVDNPSWRAQWNGKKIRDEDGALRIQVAKGIGSMAQTDAEKFIKYHHIDALAGATLTSRGVDNLVKFWMGQAGFAPFLKNLKAGEA